MSRGQVVQCTECGAKTSGRFTRCPGCGGALVAVEGAVQRQTGPQVVYVEQKRKRSAVSIMGLVLLGVCVVCGVAGGGVMLLGGLGDSDRVETTGAGPLPTATPLPSAPPFPEIRENIEGMTEAQWKAYLASLKAHRVGNWSGWVEDVNVVGSTYELWVDMDPPDDVLSGYDVDFEIPEDKALGYQKDQPVRFSGVIESVSEFLGSVTVHLVDVSVAP